MMVKLAVCLRRPATSLFPAVPEIEDRLSDYGREARSYFFPFWAQRGFFVYLGLGGSPGLPNSSHRSLKA